MATIPRSQGRDVSRPVMQQHTPITGLSAIGNAIGGALEARDNQQRENEVAAKRAELFHNQVSEQEAKVKLDDVLTREASEKVTLLKNDVSNGAMTADDASKNLQQWSDERYKQLESEMPMHARQTLQSHWSDNVNRNATGFLPLQLRADAQKGGVIAERALDVATAIVAGKQALKNKQLIMPKQDLLKKEFNDYVGQTVSGQTANMTYSAFEAIYANVAETNGYQHKDGDDISKEIAKTALGLATGGVYEQGVKHGNQKQWKVSKPYAMDDARFEAHLQKGYATISDRTGMSVADLKDFRLIRSNTRSAKGELQYDLVNERGNPLVVNGAVWRINMIGVTK